MSQAPPAGLIEAARDELESVEVPLLQEQRHELYSVLGDECSGDYQSGYELGLQVARVMIRQNTGVVLAGIKAEDIL